MIKKTNPPREDLRYHTLPVVRINDSLQYSKVTRSPELNGLTQTSVETKIEVTVKPVGLKPHPPATSTQNKHRIFPGPFVVTSMQFTSTGGPPFDHQWGSTPFTTSSFV